MGEEIQSVLTRADMKRITDLVEHIVGYERLMVLGVNEEHENLPLNLHEARRLLNGLLNSMVK